MICVWCNLGFYAECVNPKEAEEGYIIPCAVWMASVRVVDTEGTGDIGRPMSDPADVKDPKSTGRKRAAALAPIFPEMLCEWAGLRHAGGGVVPIVGCDGHRLVDEKGQRDDGLWQGDRHHGPDKNTLNNAVGFNLHRICVSCHHRWHSLNDPYYDEPRPPADVQWSPSVEYYRHDPVTKANKAEYEDAEAWWLLPKKDRGDYPIIASDTLTKVAPI